MENLRDEAIKIMKMAGQRFCDETIKMWTTGQYSDAPQEQREQMYKRWQKIKDIISQFGKEH